MVYASIGLFALAAIFGITILVSWLNQKNAPRAVVYSHGILAASALVLLAIYAFQNPSSYLTFSVILFVAAALGGFYMFARDMQGKNSPMALAGIHAVLAVGGLLTLLFITFS